MHEFVVKQSHDLLSKPGCVFLQHLKLVLNLFCIPDDVWLFCKNIFIGSEQSHLQESTCKHGLNLLFSLFLSHVLCLSQAFINTAKEIYEKIQEGVFDINNEVRHTVLSFSFFLEPLCSRSLF